MKNYKLAIFDLDGTLLDTTAGVLKSIVYTIKELELPMLPIEKLKEFNGPPIYESFQNVYSLNDEQTKKATELFRAIYKDVYLFEATVYSGIYDVITTLKKRNIKLAIATNKRNDYAQKLLKYYKFTELFDYISGSDMDNKMKKADIVTKCLENFPKISKEESVLIGDTVNDLVGAKKCGIDFIAVSYGFGFHTIEEALNNGAVDAVDDCNDLVRIIL